MNHKTIETAVTAVGSQAELARLIGVSPAFVGKMVKTGVVPASRCRLIESVTKGVVTAEQLRPDIFCHVA